MDNACGEPCEELGLCVRLLLSLAFDLDTYEECLCTAVVIFHLGNLHPLDTEGIKIVVILLDVGMFVGKGKAKIDLFRCKGVVFKDG